LNELNDTEDKIFGAIISKGIPPVGYTFRGNTIVFNHGRLLKIHGKVPTRFPKKNLMKETLHLRRFSL